MIIMIIMMIIVMIIVMIFHVTSLSTTSPYSQRVRSLVEPFNQCIFTWTLLIERNRKYTTLSIMHTVSVPCAQQHI